MSEPQIEILGVYRLPVTEELFREQFDILYGYEMTEAERDNVHRLDSSQLNTGVAELAQRNVPLLPTR